MNLMREKLRDDRLYVMNLCRGFVRQDGDYTEIETPIGNPMAKASRPGGKRCWVLTTYRNNSALPITRVDYFFTAHEANQYVKFHEPMTPLSSMGEKPLKFTSEKTIWSEWKGWLSENNLESCLGGKLHRPDWARR
jgi:hypothetical protein